MYSDFYMNQALIMAEIAFEADEVPVGAIVVKDGIVIGTGFNKVMTNTSVSSHAEILAIRAACKNIGSHILDGCIIYTSCEPCPMCLSAIYWARIKFIYFGNRKSDAAAIGFDDAHIYQQIALPEGQRSIPTNQMLSEEAIISFQKWTQSEFKIEY